MQTATVHSVEFVLGLWNKKLFDWPESVILIRNTHIAAVKCYANINMPVCAAQLSLHVLFVYQTQIIQYGLKKAQKTNESAPWGSAHGCSSETVWNAMYGLLQKISIITWCDKESVFPLNMYSDESCFIPFQYLDWFSRWEEWLRFRYRAILEILLARWWMICLVVSCLKNITAWHQTECLLQWKPFFSRWCSSCTRCSPCDSLTPGWSQVLPQSKTKSEELREDVYLHCMLRFLWSLISDLLKVTVIFPSFNQQVRDP